MTLIDADVMKKHTEYNKGPRQKVGNNGHHNFLSVHWFIFQAWGSYDQPLKISFVFSYPRTTDTQWRHKSKISEKLGRSGRQNMLQPYLRIWKWEWIFGRAVKAISSLGIRSPWFSTYIALNYKKNMITWKYSPKNSIIDRPPCTYASQFIKRQTLTSELKD